VIITCVMTVDGPIEAPVPVPDGWLIVEGDHEPPEFELLKNSAGLALVPSRASWWRTASSTRCGSG
jgi:hypothetical protein